MHGLLHLRASWSSCEHDRGAISITVSKSIGKIEQLSQSFDREHLRTTTLLTLLFTIGVRPRPGNLHGTAIEMLNDEAMLVGLQHLELPGVEADDAGE